MSWKGFLPENAIVMRRRAALSPAAPAVAPHEAFVAEGNLQARLVFVGGSPTEEESRTSRVFVGPPGQLLDKMITAMGLSREQVYLANLLQAPGQPISECLTLLVKKLTEIRPEVVVLLGELAAQAFLSTELPLSQLRGKFHSCDRLPSCKLLATFHPADLLLEPALKREAWDDLKQVAKELALPISRS